MKVARWGNSLAVRLPQSVVDELALSEGDEIDFVSSGERRLGVVLDRTREDLFARMEAISRPLPPGYRFDRNEANDR